MNIEAVFLGKVNPGTPVPFPAPLQGRNFDLDSEMAKAQNKKGWSFPFPQTPFNGTHQT
jgi:hypothetical protein